MQTHGLSDRHIDIIRAILAPYADRILRVAKTLLTQDSATPIPLFSLTAAHGSAIP